MASNFEEIEGIGYGDSYGDGCFDHSETTNLSSDEIASWLDLLNDFTPKDKHEENEKAQLSTWLQVCLDVGIDGNSAKHMEEVRYRIGCLILGRVNKFRLDAI